MTLVSNLLHKVFLAAACVSLIALAVAAGTVPASAANARESAARTIQTDSQPYHYLYNWQSGKCLNVPGGSKKNGVQLDQWACSGWTSQMWEPIVGFGPVGEVTFRNEATGQCMNVRGYSTKDGAAIQQWPCHLSNPLNPPNEVFVSYACTVSIYGYNWCEWEGLQSGLCLNIKGNSTADGANLQQWGCGAGRYNELFAEVEPGHMPPCPCGPEASTAATSAWSRVPTLGEVGTRKSA
jgi:hypothetical protein